MKYTVTVENKEQLQLVKDMICDNEADAIKQAEKWAEEHSDKLVFIRFERETDGATCFINTSSGGASAVVGRSWTARE